VRCAVNSARRSNVTFGGDRGVLFETLFDFFENCAAKQREKRQEEQQHRTLLSRSHDAAHTKRIA
jgi:hypothetical protein